MKENPILQKIEAGIKEGNGLIAQELVNNIEKFGIPPVISINGELKKIRAKLVDSQEIEEFVKSSQNYKKGVYHFEDFYFLETTDAKYKKNKSVLSSGGIICVSKKSGKFKEYKANCGSSWIENFISDLKEKSF